MSCIKPNFSLDRASGEINQNLFGEYNNIKELEDNILKVLKEEKTSFSVSPETSEDPINYEKSIDLLIKTILDKLDIGELAKRRVRKTLYKALLPNTINIIKLELSAVIADADLISELERKARKYNDIIDEFFEDNPAARARREEIVSSELLLSSIINTHTGVIVANAKDLNTNLERYKANEYIKIRNYLENLGYKGYASGLYSNHKINSESFNNLMKDMYNVILNKIKNDEMSSELRSSWSDSVFGKRSDFYDAVNAYITLMHFDDVLENSLHTYIRIDDSLIEPITKETDSFGKITFKYKYSFNAGNAETVKGWETAENRDAIKEMGKFSKLIIESIPFYNYQTKEKLNINLNAVRFSNAITRLFDISDRLDRVEYSDFLELINTRHLDPELVFPKILETVLKDTSLRKKLKELGLTDFDLNVLYSIKKLVYDGKLSYNAVEQDFIAKHGELTTRYPIVRTLLGTVDSTVTMNYLLHKYNFNDDEYQTTIKVKYPTDRVVYDMTTNINRNIVNESDKDTILEKYKLRLDKNNNRDYLITVGNFTYRVLADKNGRGLGALNKTNKSSRYVAIENLPKLDLSDKEYRNRLLTGKNLSREESNFMDALSFIDEMLKTTFSVDDEGLIEFGVYDQIDKRGLENLLLAASRGLIITDIYRQFENDRAAMGLTKIELATYLEKNPDIYPVISNIANLDQKDRKHLLSKYITGEYLTTVASSELWLHNLSHAKAILSGEVSKAVIKNLENDSIPNFSPAFEGSFIKRRGYLAGQKNEASAYLLFSLNPNALQQVVIDTDVSVLDGRKKAVKNMTKGELLFHSIVDKYFLPQLQATKQLIILPTTYSDKTKFINYIINSKINREIDLATASTDKLEDLMLNTLGEFYKKVWNNVLEDYEKIFGTRDIKEISNLLKLLSERAKIITESTKVKTTAEELLVQLGKAANVEIHVDTHYRTINGKLLINELLNQYANHTYANKQELQKRLALEKKKFVESLIKNRVHFNMSLDKGSITNSKNDLTTVLIDRLGPEQAKSWVSGLKMIIAKIKSGNRTVSNIIYGTKIKLEADQTLELNPLLENFFMVHSLVGNNTRHILSGSEINHKIKQLGKLNLANTYFAKFTNLLANYGIADLSSASLVDMDYAILLAELNNDLNAQELRQLYDNYIYEYESLAQNAQLKRNVIIPATLRYYLQNTLNGITSTMKVAVINDISAEVFNFDGIQSGIDAHDGAALEDPFTSMLENLSLQDNEVGTIKKPIWHHYNHRYGTAYLAKYAVHTMTNLWMRLSEASTISLLNLFKKMTNLQWKEPIDLITGCSHRKGVIDFNNNILENQKLFYRKGNSHYLIIDFKRDLNGDYYTVEIEVSANGNNMPGAVKTNVYHYFDSLGNHTNIKSDSNHTINSLYELHSALGGIWSESLTNNGLQYSEASVKAVVNFMNSVTVLRPGVDPNNITLDQTSYRLPLKEYVISYAANNSSIKNGAANRNSNKVFTTPYSGEGELQYMTVTTEGHGVQMDADHTSDEALMTEFSLVISSLDAGGRLHGYVKQIYNVLGQVALEQALIEVSALEEFKKSGNISAVYDIVGRTIINNASGKRGLAGLADSIIKTIKKLFDLNSDHALDTFKIPFSDPNIYSNILSTFVSIINNKSIKRKYSGQGTVMVPGYGMSLIWEFNGRTYLYEDLIKLALNNLVNISDYSNIFDISKYNKAIVEAYLQQEQNKIDFTTSLDSFLPTDIVDVFVDGTRRDTIVLDSIKNYYDFKENPSVFLFKRGIITTNALLSYRKNITKARDLAPAKISFKYETIENGKTVIKETNIFDTWALRDAYKLNLKRSDPKVLANVLMVLDGLEKGLYIDSDGKTIGKIVEMHNIPAELIMSNIYKSRFKIKDGLSLNDVLDNISQFVKEPEIINSDFYDLVYTKGNGNHLYITFNRFKQSSESFDYSRKDWNYINRVKFDVLNAPYTYNENSKIYENSDKSAKILNRVYVTNKDNIRLFEVGRDIINPNIDYDPKLKKFVNKDGVVVKNLKKYRRLGESKVTEYVEFVHKNEVIEDGKKYIVYDIDRNALKKVFAVENQEKSEEEINAYISKLLSKIYKSLGHSGILIQTKLKRNSAILLSKTMKGLGNELAYDTNLKDLLFKTADLLKGAPTLPKDEFGQDVYADFVVSSRLYNIHLKNYLKKLKEKITSSFAKALFFTASRIPAQTLLSFMLMRCVGYTGTATNLCFVSHWLTWLQGSDYDIDKAYIMGHSFDDNGVYIGWSNLFNYSSLEALQASEQLPMPQGRQYKLDKNGYDLTKYEEIFKNINEVEQIKLLTTIINELNDIKAVDGKVLVNSSKDSILYQSIVSHEKTKLPQDLKLESFKNFISSHIETTILNIRNMIGAYTPIDMEVLRDASIYHSSKGDTSKQMTLLNPAVVYEMLYENMTGKKVIGIAATGEKASFMWHYWLNDIIRKDIEEYEKYGKFNHSLTRVQNRSVGNPTRTNVNTLPDVNLEGVEIDNVLKLSGLITVDGMISLTLSAATDNAKELILAKINAGSKLAKCYLYLITMGYDINDIVKFMTSDILTFIDTFTEDNIYEGLNLSIDLAIELAEGKIPYAVEKHFLTKQSGVFKDANLGWENSIITDTPLKNPHQAYTDAYYEALNFIDFINEVRAHRPKTITEEEKTDIKNDIDDFKKILAGANEFSSLGRLLGLNLGLPTSKVDLRKLLEFIKNIVTDREKELGIISDKGTINDNKVKELELGNEYTDIVGNFDVVKFLRDDDYRKLAIEYQNKIKENIPIFKIINDIPLFDAILKLLGTVEYFDNLTSIKSKLFDDISNKFKERKYYVDEYMQKGLLSFIDDLIVLDFLKTNVYTFPVESGTEVFDVNWNTKKVGTSVKLNTPHGIASFKNVFENVVIPKLLKGEYYDGSKTISDENLKKNKFIQNLIRATDGETPLYKVNLDMLAKDASANNITKFLEYVTGLKMLLNALYKIQGIPLSDWFMIYNLIVNKNSYGSDRMTTLLLEFVSDNKSNFLTKYLNHIGTLDYSLLIDKIHYSIEDALIATAKTVSSTYGHKEPMLIMYTEDGPQLMIKTGYGYTNFDLLIPPVSGETKELYLQRLTNRLEYGTLRINYNSFIEEAIKLLNSLDTRAIDILKDLVRQGALIIDNICKA